MVTVNSVLTYPEKKKTFIYQVLQESNILAHSPFESSKYSSIKREYMSLDFSICNGSLIRVIIIKAARTVYSIHYNSRAFYTQHNTPWNVALDELKTIQTRAKSRVCMAVCLPDSSVRFSFMGKRMCANECVGSFSRASRGNKSKVSSCIACTFFL